MLQKLDHKYMRILDWAISIIVFGYGIYVGSAIFLILGVAGCVAAWFRPASRMANSIKKVKKQ